MKGMLAIVSFLIFIGGEVRALEVGDTATCVTLKQLAADGGEVEGCILDGETETMPVMLEFFSTTCGACIENLPKLKELQLKTKGVATLRAVAVDRSAQKVKDFVKDHRQTIHWDVALDTARDASKVFKLRYTPTLFLLDAKKKVIYKHVGVLKAKDIADIEKLLP